MIKVTLFRKAMGRRVKDLPIGQSSVKSVIKRELEKINKMFEQILLPKNYMQVTHERIKMGVIFTVYHRNIK